MLSWRGALQALRQDFPLKTNYTMKTVTVKLRKAEAFLLVPGLAGVGDANERRSVS